VSTNTATPSSSSIPNRFGIDTTQVPRELWELRIWLNWHFLVRKAGEKPTKVPCTPSGGPASTTDPTTWSLLQDVLCSTAKVDGIGLVFTGEVDPNAGLCLGGIDFDALKTRKKNETDDEGMKRRMARAMRIIGEVQKRNGYIEASPSRTGLHVLGWMQPMETGFHQDDIEIYTWGRYFTFTGLSTGGGLVDISELVNYLIVEIGSGKSGRSSKSGKSTGTRQPPPGVNAAVDTTRAGALVWEELPANVQETIHWWLNGITDGGPQDRAARNRLWINDLSDHNDDHSAADLSLVSQLIHRGLTDDEVDLAMRASGLFREKWDSRRPGGTYGLNTIASARQETPGGGWGGTGGVGGVGVAQPPGATPVPIRYSDNALSYLFSDEHAGDLLYVHEWGKWLVWCSSRWCPDPTVKVYDAIRVICAREGQVASRQIATTINKASTVAGIERLARHHHRHAREIEQFDADPMVLNTPVNTLTLNDQAHREHHHRREDLLARSTTVGAAATSDCPIWKAFLLRIMANDQSMADYLQRACGYTLTGSVEEHALFFGYGSGANGKGTFAGVLLGILGAARHGYAAVAPTSTFTASKTEQHPTDLAKMQGKRMVIAQETSEGRYWDIAKIKMMTGGDRITARFMRQDFFEYDPQFKLWVMGNHKPSLSNVDEATRRRLHLIPFTVKIPAGERDKQLGAKLKDEYPQILRWMIEGYDAWQRIGLSPPTKVIDATNSYLADEDSIGNWIGECCTTGANDYGTLEDLFRSWRSWTYRNGELTGSRKELAKALDARDGLTRKPDPKTRLTGWCGIAVDPSFGREHDERDDVTDPDPIDDLLR
jgi:putative DNA primase/helicase